MPFDEADWSLSSKYTGDELAQEAKDTADEAAKQAAEAEAQAAEASRKAEVAHESAQAAEQAAGKATTAASEATVAASQATTAAGEATTAAQAATNGLVEANKQIAATKADVEAVQADIATQQSELDTVSNTMDATLESIGDLSSLDTTLVSKVEQSAAQITSTVSDVTQLKTDMDDAQADITAAATAAASAQTKANEAATAASTAQTKANEATAAAATAKAEAVTAAEQYADDIAETLQGQIDGAIETWSGTVAPTASNAPANSWTDAATKKKHVGDLYYDTKTGYAYRYGTEYTWTLIKDTDVTKAIADAAAAQTAADNAQSTANTAKTNAATAQTAATNAATAASTAQADVDSLKPRVTSAESSITQLSDSITAEVSAREGTDEQVSTLTQTANGLRVDVDAANNGVNTLNSYLEYADGTLTLGKEGDPSKVQIDNDSMDIVVDGATAATVTTGSAKFAKGLVAIGGSSYQADGSTEADFCVIDKNTGLSPAYLRFLVDRNGSGISRLMAQDALSNVYSQVAVEKDRITLVSDSTATLSGSGLSLSDPLGIDSGGTGASTSTDALANLGAAAISHTHSADDITSGTLPITSGGTGATTESAARTNLGLGSLATQSTAAISNGGTGATTAAAARTNLGITPANIGAVPTSGGTITGTLQLTRTTDASGTADNKPALMVGAPTGAHIEVDGNEIMAKASGTATNVLALNADGGNVSINGTQLKGDVNWLYGPGAAFTNICTQKSNNYPVYGARVLYENASGTTGTATLAETAANFVYIEIFFAKVEGTHWAIGSTKVFKPNGKRASLVAGQMAADNATTQLLIRTYNISGTSVSAHTVSKYYNLGGATGTDSTAMRILAVIGYR